MKVTTNLMLLILFFVTTINCVSQKKVAYDTIPKYIEKIQTTNFNNINKLTIENKKNSIFLIELKKRVRIVEKDFRKIQEKPILSEIRKSFFYLISVLLAFLLASFSLSEEIKEIYGDESTKNRKKYNSTKTKNFYYTLLGLFLTILFTISQFSLDTDRIWLVYIYGTTLIIITLLLLKFYNLSSKQSYSKKTRITQKNVKRWFYRKINKKDYCEVCLKNCEKKDVQVGYLKQNEKKRILFLRFGHSKCVKIHFKEYENLLPSVGGYSKYEKVLIPLNDLVSEIAKIEEFQNSIIKNEHQLKMDTKVSEKIKRWLNIFN